MTVSNPLGNFILRFIKVFFEVLLSSIKASGFKIVVRTVKVDFLRNYFVGFKTVRLNIEYIFPIFLNLGFGQISVSTN